MGVFAAAFGLSFAAGLIERGRFAPVLLALSFGRTVSVWLGVLAGAALLDGAAVLAASALPFPARLLRLGAGVAFLGLAALAVRRPGDIDPKVGAWLQGKRGWGAFGASFALAAAVELGALTQLAAAALAAGTGRPLPVFLGTLLGRGSLSAAAIAVGPAPPLRSGALVGFAAAGLWLLAGR